MEDLKGMKEEQRKIEGVVLVFYCIYNVGILKNSRSNGWESWELCISIGWILSLIVYLRKYRNYRFRAIFTSVMMQVGMIFYEMQVPDLFSDLVNVIASTVLLGMYGIPEIIGIAMFSTTFLFGYHALFLGTIQLTTMSEPAVMLQRIASMYLAEYIEYFMVKKRREANERKSQIIEELVKTERTKDDFLANVSHELRTPINTICGMCEIVQQADLPGDVRDDVFDIQTAGKNLLSVVSDMLDFSELQSGKIELAEVTYNITSTVNDVINMIMACKSEKQIELIVDCDADIPCGLLGDEQKIRRVIMNLLSNAIKFTNEGCVILRISCRKTDYGINLLIKIKDTGIGMKEESIEKLFTRYNQVDTGRNRQEGGIGLGLAISQAIVDEMGGFITVKSEWGRGSEMQVAIPQKIVDETPIVSVKEPGQINAAVYVDMERMHQGEVRDAYISCMMHMMNQLGVKCQVCHRLAELKRKAERENFTHIFISLPEYKEDEAYFDEMAQYAKVIVILEQTDEKEISNKNLMRIYKPFFVLTIVLMLNDEQSGRGSYGSRHFQGGFIAPDVHVLVVDDNVMNLRVVEGLLRPYQIKVSTATSGREALERIETKDYDFVFMDHMMPEMDGIETLHRIRQKEGEYYKKVPVIALTANAISGMRETFLADGFQDFIAKPIELSVLERVLKRNIPEQKIVRVGNSIRKTEQTPFSGEMFEIGDLDVQKGLAYCGGMENYLEVLVIHCRDGADNIEKIEQFYRQKDWKNYTILVHALKGSMLSIGAETLSGMAKELEQAGKEEREEYILTHHEAMIEEYKRILAILADNAKINSSVAVHEEHTVSGEAEEKELSEEEFDKFVEELDEAVYTLEGEAMLAVVERMQQYSYHGYSLKEELKPVIKKIDMSDFMSAAEVVRKLKTKEKGVM